LTVYQSNPLEDPRWDEFVQRHPRSSVFHTKGWLAALQRTYGYDPVIFTTTPPGQELRNGLVFCRIHSWLTGRRLVSLPFSDHCQPLLDDETEPQDLFDAVRCDVQNKNYRYTEMRPLAHPAGGQVQFKTSEAFCHHQLELCGSLDELFRAFHKDCVQRKIRRAQREQLAIENGRSDVLMNKFYSLSLRTRRRHQLPPQPSSWFRNLADCLKDRVKIYVASKNDKPVASILTLWFRDTLVYKNGCSDDRFHHLGGMPLLLWAAIEEAKKNGLRAMDWGRSDVDNSGLITFKDRWGATKSQLTYVRWPSQPVRLTNLSWKTRVGRQVFAHLPDGLLVAAGRFLYQHIG
jgi:hypothetical protein